MRQLNEYSKWGMRYLNQNFWLLVRYGVSGVSGIVANLVVFSVATEYFTVWYMYAALLGFVAAYVVTFTMHKFWTFDPTALKRTTTQSVIYFCSAVATLGINTFILFILVHFFALWPVLAQALSLGMAAVLSFIFTSQVTFHAEEQRLRTFFSWVERQLSRIARSDRSLLWFLVIIMTLTVLYRWEFYPLSFTGDASGFVGVAEVMQGAKESDVFFAETRYLKPLGSGVVAFFMQLGYDAKSALLAQSVLMYYVLGLAAYWFGRVLFRDALAAFLTGFLVVTSYPIVRYGLDYFMETGSWAWYFMSLAGLVLWWRTPRFRYVVLIALTLLAGVLWKEYAVLAGLMFAIAIIARSGLTWWQRLNVFLQTACLVLIPWGMWQWYIWERYQYSYIDWYLVGTTGYDHMYIATAVIKSSFVLLAFAWVFVLLGIYFWRRMEGEVRRIAAIICVPSFGFLLWGFVSSRLFFSLVPFAVIPAVHGMMQLPKRSYVFGAVLFILLVNALLLWIGFDPDVRELLDRLTYG